MLEKASNAKKILMLFMSENAKNYAGLFYRWLPADSTVQSSTGNIASGVALALETAQASGGSRVGGGGGA